MGGGCWRRRREQGADWGDGRAIDLIQGEFIKYNPNLFSHPVQDDELETLRHMGRVSSYDAVNVFLVSIPEMPPRDED